MTLFSSSDVGEKERRAFDALTAAHLRRFTLPQRLTRRRTVTCPSCGTPIPDQHVQLRLARGFSAIVCNVCDTAVPLLDEQDPLLASEDAWVARLERAADTARAREVAAALTGGGGGS